MDVLTNFYLKDCIQKDLDPILKSIKIIQVLIELEDIDLGFFFFF
jgi:hypothetical protein